MFTNLPFCHSVWLACQCDWVCKKHGVGQTFEYPQPTVAALPVQRNGHHEENENIAEGQTTKR